MSTLRGTVLVLDDDRVVGRMAAAVAQCSEIAQETTAQASRTGDTLKELVRQTAKLHDIVAQLQQD